MYDACVSGGVAAVGTNLGVSIVKWGGSEVPVSPLGRGMVAFGNGSLAHWSHTTQTWKYVGTILFGGKKKKKTDN